MEGRHDVDAQPADVDLPVRVYGDYLALGYELLDERHDRRRQDDAGGRRPLEDHSEQRKIEMVEVLVGDQDASRPPPRRAREEAAR